MNNAEVLAVYKQAIAEQLEKCWANHGVDASLGEEETTCIEFKEQNPPYWEYYLNYGDIERQQLLMTVRRKFIGPLKKVTIEIDTYPPPNK